MDFKKNKSTDRVSYDNPGFTNIQVISEDKHLEKNIKEYNGQKGIDESNRTYSEESYTDEQPKKQSRKRSKCCLALTFTVVGLIIAGGIAVGIYFGVRELTKKSDKSDKKWHKMEMNSLKTKPTEFFMFHEILDENFVLYWKVKDERITFETHVRATGYIGFGISANGKMFPSDIVIGWINNGEGVLSDRHGLDHSLPALDKQQDWELISASTQNEIMIMKFSRDLDTCDEQDVAIKEGTTRVIFSYSNTRPFNKNKIAYHGNRKGSRSLFLLDPPLYETNRKLHTQEVQSFKFVKNKFLVPSDRDTTYHCSVHKVPQLKGKRHIIQWEPVIQKGNERYVHHMILYFCAGSKINPDKYDGHDYLCHKESPAELKWCFNVFIGWAIGGREFYFPDHVGIPIGTENDPKFFILETHYDNPDLESGIVDNSGILLTYTANLRMHEAGNLFLGAQTNKHLIVPPGEENYVFNAFCPSECITDALEGGEINVIAGVLHSHLLGSVMKLRVIRGEQEVKPLLEDQGYDFNFQESRIITPEYKIKPGDRLILECGYKTTNRSSVSYGGLGTKEEMCVAFLTYYPKIPLHFCASQLQYETPEGFSSFPAYAESLNWADDKTHKEFKELSDSVPVSLMCAGERQINGHGLQKAQNELRPAVPLAGKTSKCKHDRN